MNNPIKTKIKVTSFTLILMIFILSTIRVLSITGTGGSYTVDGQTATASFNSTSQYDIRGLSDYIAGQFKYPSATEILFRGRFSQLEAENTAPTTPALISPNNDTYSNISLQEFSWTNSTDLEQDIISYLFEIHNDSLLTQPYEINHTIQEIPTPTSTEINLTEDGDYYWAVLANDSRSNSTFTSTRIITIDQTLPANFNITAPEDASSSTDNTPELQWDSSSDTNFNNYTIEVSTVADFSTISNTEVSTTNIFTGWSSPLAADTYYWRVSAVDKANNQRLSDNNLSFIITAVTQTTTVAGAASSVSGGSTPRPYSFHIIAPPSVTIFKGESIVVPIEIENSGRNINLNRISLSAEADTPGVIVTLDRTLIQNIPPDTKTSINLIINAENSFQNTFSISITANVDEPELSDSVRIITSIVGEEGQTQESAQNQLVFAKKFFDGNPGCQELTESLDLAEQQISEGDYNSAFDSITKAVESCKDLVAIKTPAKTSILDITLNAVRENKTTAIVSSQLLGVLIIGGIIYGKFLRKKKIRDIKLDF